SLTSTRRSRSAQSTDSIACLARSDSGYVIASNVDIGEPPVESWYLIEYRKPTSRKELERVFPRLLLPGRHARLDHGATRLRHCWQHALLAGHCPIPSVRPDGRRQDH